MLFYLLIKKDGTTVFPTPDAVHPDIASSSQPPRGDSTPPPAAAPAAAATHLQQKSPQPPQSLVPPAAESAVDAAAEGAVQNIGNQAVPTSHASATQVSTANPDQPAGQPSVVNPHPDPSMQQQLAACEPGAHVSGSSGGLLQASASSLEAGAPSLPAVPASPQLPHSSQLPQFLLPQPAPASPQLQPAPPQLQPVSPQLLPASPHLLTSSSQLAASAPQASSQQLSQQLQDQAPQAAAGQDISKEFLALLQETSTHLAGSQPSWPNQAGPQPSTAGHQPAEARHSDGTTSAVDTEGLGPCDNGTAMVDRTGPAATSPSGQAQIGDQGDVSSHVFHLLMLQKISIVSRVW